jgi:hypothetical protein
MADEKQESRIKVENLPQPEQELTPEEAKQVQGGGSMCDGSVHTKSKSSTTSIQDGTSNTLMSGQ